MFSSNTLIHVDDGINEYESVLKRQKSTTSKAWDEITKLESVRMKESLAFGKLSRRESGFKVRNQDDEHEACQGVKREVVIDNEVAKKVGKSAKGHFERNVC
ncbi:hypothetical protein Godav_022381 [Gossypium davidsonii]|uniref:Uncharacterized protein n=2 Tax=Gossypium TaxID=3633 RepID=A0A7J8THQ9_GOSDV|nr:hypothetical protein [Gossypium davidsonii]MBA0655875.1 hypothetical protein [Gossypium klotzschianum]